MMTPQICNGVSRSNTRRLLVNSPACRPAKPRVVKNRAAAPGGHGDGDEGPERRLPVRPDGVSRRACSGASRRGRGRRQQPHLLAALRPRALALMSTGASGDTLAEILAVAGAPSREELRAFVRAVVIDRVLADQSGAGGPVVAFACGAWTDKRMPLRPEYRDTIGGAFKGTATTVDFKDKVRTTFMFSWISNLD
ncbi:hypothetical protein GQ55_8G080500 [Panicum hallii var. hallii]|uniref:Serpin domain-containing protein n=1 Tax=Panicum hallii var. hallii TaxID=1504633 RepID=A0A2T7CLY2_9POAL|nr:hypothetical protein GQ55_8G080500 [Panicum hallii var. hallii]